jgi:hypothetical protein
MEGTVTGRPPVIGGIDMGGMGFVNRLSFTLVVTAASLAGLLPRQAAGQDLEPLLITDFRADRPDVARGDRVLRITLPRVFRFEERAPNGKVLREADLILTVPVSEGRVRADQAEARLQGRGVAIEVSDGTPPLTLEKGRLSGTLTVKVKPPATTQPAAAAATQAFAATIKLELTVTDRTFGYTPDRDASIPPWRSDKTKPNGFVVTGRWWMTVPKNNAATEGFVDGLADTREHTSFGLRLTPGKFSPVGLAELGEANSGMKFVAHLAKERVASTEVAWAVKLLDRPLDLSKFTGVRLTVSSKKAYTGPDWNAAPVGVAVAVRSKGGPWYMARTVAPLLGDQQRWEAGFELFDRGGPGVGQGPNLTYFLDVSQIDAIAIGVVNPFGVGDLEFVAEKLEAVRTGDRGFGQPRPPARVTVDPAVVDAYNDARTVPPGLFGFHVVGDLKSDAALATLRATRPGYLRPLQHTSMARAKELTAADAVTQRVALEQKLRQPDAPGQGPIPPAAAAAADALDRVVLTVTNENLWARPKWMDGDVDRYAEGIRWAFREWGAKAWMPAHGDRNTLRAIEFWNEPFMWGRHINRGGSTLSAGPGDPGGNRGGRAWDDPTQFSYIPANLGAEIYAKFFNAAAEGLRDVNEHTRLGGMSSPAFGDEFYEHFRRYVARWMELSKDHIGFLTEHHYQGDPRSFSADALVVRAYTKAKFDTAWPIINTEANDLDDVAPGDQRSPEMASAIVSMNRAYYNGREILEHIRHARDIVEGRALHALWQNGRLQTDGEQSLYTFLADLRGDVLWTESSDEAMVAVTSRRGDDVVMVVLNDSPFSRKAEVVGLDVSKAVVTRLSLATDRSAVVIEPVKADEPMRPREFRKFVVTGVPAPTGERVRQRTESTLVLADTTPHKPATGQIQLPALYNGTKVWAQVVTRDVQTGEATLTIGDVEIPLPPSSSNSGGQRVQMVELTADQVASLRKLPPGRHDVVARATAGCDGYTVYAASLVTSSP